MRGPPQKAVAVALDDLDRAFPFALLFDRAGIIRHVGPSLAKLTRPNNLTDQAVFDALTFKKPRHIDPKRLLQNVLNQRLTCAVPGGVDEQPILLFGIAFNVRIDRKMLVLLALTPGVNTRLLVEDKGMRLSDFGAADGSADLLPLLAMQTEMIEDSKKKSARLEAARAEMERLANEDALTGLPNRRALLRSLERWMQDVPVSVIHIDLDRFKEINDSFGHAAGDAALCRTADCLRRVCGADALCSRLGGDEFIVALTGDQSGPALERLARCIMDEMSAPFSFGNEKISMGASTGIAQSFPDTPLTSDELLHHADLALYEIKRTGRGKPQICTPDILAAHTSFQEMSADIRRGMANNEFVAYLQPQIQITTGEVVGFEALARWQHPTRGLLTPGSFLGMVERAGLMRNLDAIVRQSALGAFKTWTNEGLWLPKVSLNVTTHDLLDRGFHETLSWEIDEHDLSPNQLVLEIVESVFFDKQSSQVLETCTKLTDQGYTLALDDFGTGHASILSLVEIPVSIVKIDRAFASGIANDKRKRTLTRSMIEMACGLGLLTLAEGVEAAHDLDLLHDLGCHMVQGYHIGEPMSQAEAAVWMKAWQGIHAVRQRA